jgi:hypothetical protein
MIFVIIYNFFCYTLGLEDMQIKSENFQKIFALELISAFLYTYIGHILTLFFMQKKENYKEISIICMPATIITMLIVTYSNELIMNAFIMFFYFIYQYFKNPTKKTILKTAGYLLIITIIQSIFYVFKYYIFGMHYNDITSDVLRGLMNCDYYLFILVIIIIKNKLRGK